MKDLYNRLEGKIDKENLIFHNRESSFLTFQTFYFGGIGGLLTIICANQLLLKIEVFLKFVLLFVSIWAILRTANAYKLLRAANITIDELQKDWDKQVRDPSKTTETNGNLARDQWANKIWVDLVKEPVQLSAIRWCGKLTSTVSRKFVSWLDSLLPSRIHQFIAHRLTTRCTRECFREALYVYLLDNEGNRYLVFPPIAGKFPQLNITDSVRKDLYANIVLCVCMVGLLCTSCVFPLTSLSSTVLLGGTTNGPVPIISVAPSTNYIYGLMTNIVASNAPTTVTIAGVFTNELKGVVTNSFDEKSMLKINATGRLTNEVAGSITNTISSNSQLSVSIDETVRLSVPDAIKTKDSGEIKLLENVTNDAMLRHSKKKKTSGISILIGHQSEVEDTLTTNTNQTQRQ